MDQAFFTAKEVCKRLGMDPRQFRQFVEQGIFPRGIRRGKRLRVWSEEDIQAMIWLEKFRHRLRDSRIQRPKPPPT